MAVERVRIDFVESRGNLYKVPMRQWRKWDAGSRKVFNEVYSSMNRSQGIFTHPKQEQMPRQQWKTICWNAAWTAASASEKVSRV